MPGWRHIAHGINSCNPRCTRVDLEKAPRRLFVFRFRVCAALAKNELAPPVSLMNTWTSTRVTNHGNRESIREDATRGGEEKLNRLSLSRRRDRQGYGEGSGSK